MVFSVTLVPSVASSLALVLVRLSFGCTSGCFRFPWFRPRPWFGSLLWVVLCLWLLAGSVLAVLWLAWGSLRCMGVGGWPKGENGKARRRLMACVSLLTFMFLALYSHLYSVLGCFGGALAEGNLYLGFGHSFFFSLKESR